MTGGGPDTSQELSDDEAREQFDVERERLLADLSSVFYEHAYVIGDQDHPKEFLTPTVEEADLIAEVVLPLLRAAWASGYESGSLDVEENLDEVTVNPYGFWPKEIA